MGQLRGAAVEHDDDAVDAAAVLDVEVGVDRRCRRLGHVHDRAELDVLLERDLQVVDPAGEAVGGTGAVGGDRVGDLLGQGDEVVGLGREVGLGLELDDGGAGVAVADGDHALDVLAVGAGGGLGQALLPQHLGGGVEVAVGFDERLLGVHHPGAGGLRSAWTSLAVKSAIGDSGLLVRFGGVGGRGRLFGGRVGGLGGGFDGRVGSRRRLRPGRRRLRRPHRPGRPRPRRSPRGRR